MQDRTEPTVMRVDPVIEVYRQEVDREALRANLARSPEQRFMHLMELQRFADELRRRARRDPAGR
jgi:hypothetical protein